MRRPFRLVPAIVLFLVAVLTLSLCAAPPAKEIKALGGVWDMQVMEVDGGKIEGSAGGGTVQFFLDGNKYVSQAGQNVVEQGTIAVDPGKSPAAIDLMPNTGGQQGKVLPGIYLLRGDSLLICLATPPAARPTEFSAQKGDNHILILYKRAQPR
jgi:uncharacterized protein (TIGR03067 family)